jgi:hypothetical protein
MNAEDGWQLFWRVVSWGSVIFALVFPFVMLVTYPGDDGWSWYYRLWGIIPFICLMSCLMSHLFTVEILGYRRPLGVIERDADR